MGKKSGDGKGLLRLWAKYVKAHREKGKGYFENLKHEPYTEDMEDK